MNDDKTKPRSVDFYSVVGNVRGNWNFYWKQVLTISLLSNRRMYRKRTSDEHVQILSVVEFE